MSMRLATLALLAIIGAPRALSSMPSITWTPYGPIVGSKATGDFQDGDRGTISAITMALSGSGKTLAIGSSTDGAVVIDPVYQDGSPTGGAWVFGRTATGRWVQQGPKLSIKGQLFFGSGVALDYSGSKLAVAHLQGVVVYERSTKCGWSLKSTVLKDSVLAVSMSGLGDTLAVKVIGGIRIFGLVKSGAKAGKWAQQGGVIKHNNAGASSFGTVNFPRLDHSGDTLVVAPALVITMSAIFPVGVVVYKRKHGVWAPLDPRLTSKSIAGVAVAVSGNGKTIATGLPGANMSVVVWTFGKSGKLEQQGPPFKVDPGDVVTLTLALNYDGSVLAVGVPTRSDLGEGRDYGVSLGFAVVFSRNKNQAWSRQGAKLEAAGQGYQVALDNAGKTLAVGNHASWVYTQK